MEDKSDGGFPSERRGVYSTGVYPAERREYPAASHADGYPTSYAEYSEKYDKQLLNSDAYSSSLYGLYSSKHSLYSPDYSLYPSSSDLLQFPAAAPLRHHPNKLQRTIQGWKFFI